MRKKGRIAVVIGTRPEGIKLCPLVLQMRESGMDAAVFTSGQHGDLLSSVMDIFGVQADVALAPVHFGEDLCGLVSHLLRSFGECFAAASPSLAVVQGDTATAYAAALAAFLARIPVMHVEAGLRTGAPFSPFPEEAFRREIAAMASLHIAPSPQAMRHLWQEGVPKRCTYLFGNTVEDALRRLLKGRCRPSRQAVLTVHRREHSEAALRGIFFGVRALMDRLPALSLLYPMHPSPRVRCVAEGILGGHPRIRLSPPLPVLDFYRALASAPLVLTDSGGVQEEASLLGIRTLVLRENTERESELQGGGLMLGGTAPERIVSLGERLLSLPPPKRKESRIGSPSARICKLLLAFKEVGFDKQRLFQGF